MDAAARHEGLEAVADPVSAFSAPFAALGQEPPRLPPPTRGAIASATQ